MDSLDRKILKLLSVNARMDVDDIATVLDLSAGEVAGRIAALEKNGVICGYKSVIDWEKVDTDSVSAIIELKVTPKAGYGFEEVAARVAKYPEVESVYLMSGGYDLSVVIEGKTMKEVAYFVAYKLAPIEDVVSTATHFVLKKYKDKGVIYKSPEKDERESFI